MGYEIYASSIEECIDKKFTDVYRHPVFTEAMNKYFDIDHEETRRVLLSIDEADQNNVLTALTSRLYDNIVEKVDDIDYGDIPSTKGDVTLLPSYNKIVECLEIMDDIMDQFKQDKTCLQTVSNALENIKLRKDLFERAFKFNIELPVITYSTMVLAVISGTSLMISSCIDFIKTPAEETFNVVVDKVGLAKTKEHMLFINLQKFNKSCASGEFDKAMEYVISNRVKNLTGAMTTGVLVVAGIAGMGLILNIIPILRELIFFFYYTRTRVSDYFEVQANLLQMNAYNLENSQTLDKEDRKKISARQFKIADLFRRISNKIAVKTKEGEVKATKDIVISDKKIKTTELMDEMPDSASSSLF